MCAAPGSKTAQILEMLHAGTMMPTGTVALAWAKSRNRQYAALSHVQSLPFDWWEAYMKFAWGSTSAVPVLCHSTTHVSKHPAGEMQG